MNRHRNCFTVLRLLLLLLTSMGAGVASAVVPQVGWWWNPAESGRGYGIEVQNGVVFMSVNRYDPSGRTTWDVSNLASLNGASFSTPLISYFGGQSLTGSYHPITDAVNDGMATVTFADESHAILSWPGGTTPLQRFDIVANGSSLPKPAGTPESGWWWNAQESGRGFFLEVQSGNLFIAGNMYDSAGNPIWYVSFGPMASSSSYQGVWTLFGNGQTLTGPYHPPSLINANAGSISLTFSTPQAATLRLPSGAYIALTRYQFGPAVSTPTPAPSPSPSPSPTPSDTTPPSAPANMSSAAVTPSSISLNWQAATDNVGVTSYQIYRNRVLVGTSTTPGYVDHTGLAPATAYSYTLYALDGAGNKSASSSALAVTTADTLAAPLSLDEQPFGSLTLVDEIDTASVEPQSQDTPSGSAVLPILGRNARTLAPGASARYMTYRIGAGKGLVAKQAYVLDIEYPDDVPRALFVANRGADFLRGFTTGSAIGDSRRAWTISTLESLNYPQSSTWKNYRSLFFLHERFALKAQRNAVCSTRPLLPADGFDVTVFQTRQLNDPRANGAAIGKIRLYRVDNPAALPATISYPGSLPRRHIFWREEMADEAVSNANAASRATSNAIDWFAFKMDLGRALGFNTVGKDLMEWGWNQGFDGGNQTWVLNAQAPLTTIWDQIVTAAASRNLYLMPYLEYGGTLGFNCNAGYACDKTPGDYYGLGFQRRTRKLYDGIHPGNGEAGKYVYTNVWWTEGQSADLLDPDTETDLKRVLDKIELQYKGRANFAGLWLRLRQTKLPISFSAQDLVRYNADNPGNPRSLADLQNDVSKRDAYYTWWYAQRRGFLRKMRDYLRTGMADDSLQVLLTAYAQEPVPTAYGSLADTTGVNLVSDDLAWWSSYRASLNNTTDPDNWYRWKWGGYALSDAVAQHMHRLGLEKTFPIQEDPWTHNWTEDTHATPPADPKLYQGEDGVAVTYEFGNPLYTVGDSALLNEYANTNGQSLIHHFPLNEDNGNSYTESSNAANCSDASRYAVTADEPFAGKVGYVAVAVERAGPYSVLPEARALANGNPINLGYLESSSFSRGFPAYVRRFNQALLSLPALPATTASGMSSDASVVVRKIQTAQGTYYAAINPTLTPRTGVVIDFGSSTAAVTDLIANTAYNAPKLQFDLYPGEVRTFKVP